MSPVTVMVTRTLRAPAPAVHACIADYVHHHRPEGFLPPAFSDLEVLEGGVGAGTRIRFGARLGGTVRTMEATISEPDPGRVLVEAGSDVVSTFTVEPVADGARVTIASVMRVHGLSGLVASRLLPRMLEPLYIDELTRLEAYAAALADTDPAVALPRAAAAA